MCLAYRTVLRGEHRRSTRRSSGWREKHVDEVEIRVIREQSSRTLALMKGDVHMIETLLGADQLEKAVPRVILALAIAQALGPSLPNLILALTVTYWPWFTLIVVAETRTVKKATLVEATEALGVSPWRTILCHVLPNVLSPLIVRSILSMGLTIMTAAVLGFLGMGAQPPAPEWGAMIAEARLYLPDAWWYATAPGLAIFCVVMGFNLLGDALRDILDPRLRRGDIRAQVREGTGTWQYWRSTIWWWISKPTRGSYRPSII